MKRFFLLWLMLLAIEVGVGATWFAIEHSIDARFEPFLTALVAPAVQAALLLRCFPRLRDRELVGPGAAVRSRTMATVAVVLLGASAVLAALVVGRALPEPAFDVVRELMFLAGAAAFAVAGARGTGGALGASVILAFLAVSTGRTEQIAGHVFPSRPVGVRWFLYGITSASAVIALLFYAVNALRRSSPDAATLLEWSLAPAMLAAIIVVANFFWRPFLTPASLLAANIAGLAAAGFALLAAVAALQRKA